MASCYTCTTIQFLPGPYEALHHVALAYIAHDASAILAFHFLQQPKIVPTSRPFGEGNGTPLQYSCLQNPMGGGAWWAAVHGVARSQTRLSNFTFTFHSHALEKEMATHSSVLD